MPDRDETPFELHARRFLGRLQKLTEAFRAASAEIDFIMREIDRIWPQIRAAFAWSAASQDASMTAAEVCVEFASCGDPAGGDSPLALRQSPSETRHWVEVALVASRRLNWRLHEAGLLYQLASVAFAEQQLLEARKYAEQALPLFREVGESRFAAIALNLLGLIAIATKETDAAVQHFQESLAVFRTMDLGDDVAFTLGLLADAHATGGRFEEALHYAAEARTLSRERGNRTAELHALMTMATALARLGKAEELNAICGEAMALSGDRKTHATSLTAFGHFDLVRLVWTEDTEAVGQLERDLVAFRELGNWGGEGFALVGLGLGYLRHGNREAGRACLEQAHEVFSRHEYALGVAVSHRCLDKFFADSK